MARTVEYITKWAIRRTKPGRRPWKCAQSKHRWILRWKTKINSRMRFSRWLEEGDRKLALMLQAQINVSRRRRWTFYPNRVAFMITVVAREFSFFFKRSSCLSLLILEVFWAWHYKALNSQWASGMVPELNITSSISDMFWHLLQVTKQSETNSTDMWKIVRVNYGIS